MKKRNEHTPDPDELCQQAFSRCSNWPTDRAGQIGLAQGLKVASDRFHITQEDLIAQCRETSAFCPTDADLLKIAADMFNVRESAQQARRDMRAEWERQYGKPQPVDTALRGKCIDCGRDWKEIAVTADARRRKLWEGLRARFDPARGKWPPYRDMAPVARELGFPDFADAWERE